MAQIVGYFENDIVFKEGPFVLCNVGGRFRIESEYKGHHCSTLLHPSIYTLLESERNYKPGCRVLRECEPDVNWLNEQVHIGRIVLDGNMWTYRHIRYR